MCLSKIDVAYDKPSDLIVDGWKEFSGGMTGLRFMKFGGDVKLDTWMKAAEVVTPKDIAVSGKIGSNSYKSGFHAYADEQSKPRSAERRVYLRRITCAGEQDGKPCVVAQEMYVPSNPNDWPPKETAPQIAPKKKLMDRIRKTGRKS